MAEINLTEKFKDYLIEEFKKRCPTITIQEEFWEASINNKDYKEIDIKEEIFKTCIEEIYESIVPVHMSRYFVEGQNSILNQNKKD